MDEERPIADRIDDVPTPAEHTNLAGHADVLDDLVSQYAAGSLHHALMLTGPRGVGKATMAFHLARHLLAFPDRDTSPRKYSVEGIPDHVLRQVSNGGHPNLLHLTRPWDERAKKFKTQVTIEQVRRTQAFFSLTAGGQGYRIAIIDSADEMNAAAANALLKVLEEPPKRALFLVLSHAPGGLLPTIRSRCQAIRLRPVPDEELVPLLPVLQPDTLGRNDERIAALAQGSVRRALQLRAGKLIDEFASFENLAAAGANGAPADWLMAHRIADALLPVARASDYDLFFDLALGWIAARPRQGGLPLAAVAGWAEVWEGLNESRRLADAYNLDRKQAVLHLFQAMFSQNRRFPKAA